jgi:hypothetical protein
MPRWQNLSRADLYGISEDVGAVSALWFEVWARTGLFSGRNVHQLRAGLDYDCGACSALVGVDSVVAAEDYSVGNFVVLALGADIDFLFASALDLSGSGN